MTAEELLPTDLLTESANRADWRLVPFSRK